MNTLSISNFKCFTEVNIPINRLTVMAGANGNGKSTTIQALLFLRKTIEQSFKLSDDLYELNDESINQRIDLNNGYLLSLGNSSYITNRHLGKNEIKIGLDDSINSIEFEFDADDIKGQLYLTTFDSNYKGSNDIIKKTFYYLNAERIGPRISQAIQYYDYPNVGFQGEYVAQLIADVNYITPVEEERRHPKIKNPRLEPQVNAWLDDLMPGVRVSAIQSIETLTAQIQVENYYIKGDPTIATNIGFGISYVLPIIVTGLIAEKGSFLIVENPEAHLHPSAQSKIGRFLAMVANSGINVIIETHSDHVLNGIQIAVAKEEIEADFATINFFSQKDEEVQPNIDSISISEKGELSNWPKGFFDQTQIDFAELFKLKRL